MMAVIELISAVWAAVAAALINTHTAFYTAWFKVFGPMLAVLVAGDALIRLGVLK